MAFTTRDLASLLYDAGCIKFGEFKLKSGIMSPVYFDLRMTVSYPATMTAIATLMMGAVPPEAVGILCGVPYTALPFATVMSVKYDKPMILRRKEVKGYGTNKLLEGAYTKGDRVLIIEDVVTSGLSIMETAAVLREEGLIVTDAVVLLDREQGGREALREQGITLHSVCRVTELLDLLQAAEKIDTATVNTVKAFLESTRPTVTPAAPAAAPAASAPTPAQDKPRPTLSFGARAERSQHPIAKRLFEICERKQTNLAVAADVDTCAEVLALADAIGKDICVFKTHVDVLSDFTPAFIDALSALAAKHDFLIFEDRKFADIGNTVQKQFTGGVYNIAKWSHITNAHTLPGSGIIKGLAAGAATVGEPRGLLLLAEMSSEGNLATGAYTDATVAMARANADSVIGFIGQRALVDDPTFVVMTPGVSLAATGDALGQQYNTPEHIVTRMGSDIIIVGRGIYHAKNPAEAAAEYRTVAYRAYMERVARSSA